MTSVRESWSHLAHLSRRFFKALSRQPPSDDDDNWVAQVLLPRELILWRRLSAADQRHSIEVARRFSAAVAESPRDDIAAALLHDVGKLEAGLGTLMRVVATLVGPRTTRFREYHDHERIGVDLATEAGSTEQTLALLANTTERRDVIAALRRADHV